MGSVSQTLAGAGDFRPVGEAHGADVDGDLLRRVEATYARLVLMDKIPLKLPATP